MVKSLYTKGLVFFAVGITFLMFSSATAVQTVHASPIMNALEKAEKTKHFLPENQHLFSNLNCDSIDSFKEILSKVESLSENTNCEYRIISSDIISLIEGKSSEKIPMNLNGLLDLLIMLIAILIQTITAFVLFSLLMLYSIFGETLTTIFDNIANFFHSIIASILSKIAGFLYSAIEPFIDIIGGFLESMNLIWLDIIFNSFLMILIFLMGI